MSTGKLMTNVPFVIFMLACVAYGSWLVYDSVRPASHNRAERDALPPPPQSGFLPSGGPSRSETYLEQIKLDMSRVEVERVLAPLMLEAVEPVDTTAGKAALRSTYRARLTRPLTHLIPESDSREFQSGPYYVTLEFDGTVANHPLRRVQIAPAPPRHHP